MKYELKDIYNVGQTSLQYRLLPLKSLSRKGDNPHGMKTSKDRIAILLCVSALGDKEILLIVNKALRPRCFKNANMSQLGVH